MNSSEKLEYYATAKRADSYQIMQIIDGEFVPKWVGRLRGIAVSSNGIHVHDNPKDALECARNFRKHCQDEFAKKASTK